MASPLFANAASLRDRTPILAVALLTILAITPAASANVGSPLIWLGCFHLVFGNALIAFVEAAIVFRLLRISYGRAFLWLLAANYVSMLVGFVLLNLALEHGDQFIIEETNPIRSARWFVATMVGIAFVLTVLIEWPFVSRAARRSEGRHSFTRTFLANLLAQLVSYLVLAYLYTGAFYTFNIDITVVEADAIEGLPSDVAVYHLAPDRRSVHRIQLVNGDSEHLVTVPSGSGSAALLIEEGKAGEWSIWLDTGPDEDRIRVDRGVIADIATKWEFDGSRDLNIAPSPDPTQAAFRPREQHEHYVFAYPLGVNVTVNDVETSEHVLGLYLGAPFMNWRAPSTVLINDRFLLIQLEDQLHLIDIENRRIAYLAPGVWPVVVREQHTTNADD